MIVVVNGGIKPTGFSNLGFSALGVFDGTQKLGSSLAFPPAILEIEEDSPASMKKLNKYIIKILHFMYSRTSNHLSTLVLRHKLWWS